MVFSSVNKFLGSVYFLRVLEKTKKHFFLYTLILLYFCRKKHIKNKIISVKLFCNCYLNTIASLHITYARVHSIMRALVRVGENL